ncbi:MAG: primosomal replication protein N [Candidatus Accumulibacter sp.]|uniref:primosomal replication protein N n=1 Tax=Accumulibacter sp. TaxID=2053492 RepID=UPI002879198A|nr:primosomal replication protein N [Accumulibacter sp.]MDS4015650.1 primosomal replication protein N [Accumulibacter sp.]
MLVERQALRFTPAGVPVVEGVLRHQSEQLEAGSPRRVDCEVRLIALAAVARSLQAVEPGAGLVLGGFLAARSRHGKQLQMHVTKIEFVEGKQDGKVLQEEG